MPLNTPGRHVTLIMLSLTVACADSSSMVRTASSAVKDTSADLPESLYENDGLENGKNITQ